MVRPMQPLSLRRVLIHGPGRAGTALALRLVEAGHPAPVFSGGSRKSRQSAIALFGGASDGGNEAEPPGELDLLILAVPDGKVADEVARLAKLTVRSQGRVAHLAGVFGRSVLLPLHDLGYDTAAFHPLCSIPDRRASYHIEGAVIGLDVNAAQSHFWDALALSIGGIPVHVPEHARKAYHLAASIMGNAVQALADLSYRALEPVGLDSRELRSGLLHLMTTALTNSLQHDPHAVLTGPVARGDFATLRSHLCALDAEEDRKFYKDLVAAQVRLLRRRVLPPEFLREFDERWSEETD